MAQAYYSLFGRMGLNSVMVEADNGYIGGEYCTNLLSKVKSAKVVSLPPPTVHSMPMKMWPNFSAACPIPTSRSRISNHRTTRMGQDDGG